MYIDTSASVHNTGTIVCSTYYMYMIRRCIHVHVCSLLQYRYTYGKAELYLIVILYYVLVVMFHSNMLNSFPYKMVYLDSILKLHVHVYSLHAWAYSGIPL